MSHKSKSILTSSISGILLVAAYAFYVTRPETTPQSLQSWALTMLVFLGIAIVVLVVVLIVFHIVLAMGIAISERGDESRIQRVLASTMAEDEMDRHIGLRSARAGYVCAGIGFVAVLLTLALGGSAVVALHVLFGSFFVGSLVSGGVSVYGYERGLGHA